MTKQVKDGGPAFPNRFTEGMTLRDYFAGQAVNGILAGLFSSKDSTGWLHDDIANEAYLIADAMLDARANND